MRHAAAAVERGVHHVALSGLDVDAPFIRVWGKHYRRVHRVGRGARGVDQDMRAAANLGIRDRFGIVAGRSQFFCQSLAGDPEHTLRPASQSTGTAGRLSRLLACSEREQLDLAPV